MTHTDVPVRDFLHVLNFQIASRKRGQLFATDACYLCNRFSSLCRLGGGRRKSRKCPHVPTAPQNSFIGGEESIHKGFGTKSDLFDTSLYKEDTTPLGFKLPPVFARDVGKRVEEADDDDDDGDFHRQGTRNRKKKKKPHSRIIPTISERTFVNSNLRSASREEEVDTVYDNENYDEDFIDEEEDEAEVLDKLSDSNYYVKLPRIPSGQSNMVSASLESADDFGREGIDDDAPVTSAMERTMSMDREKTGASLHIDEDYVPMSVFIRQVDEGHGTGTGTDGVYQYEEEVTSSISGSLGVSRDTSLGESDQSNSNNWCTCMDPLTDILPCPECLHPHAHERWCTRKHETNRDSERQSACLVCGRPIRPQKVKKRDRPGHGKRARSLNRRDSRFQQTPETAVTKSYDHINDRSTCSGKTRSGGHKRSSRASLDLVNSDLHVRFDEQVQILSADNERLNDHSALLNSDQATDNSNLEQRKSPLFKKRNPISKPTAKIPNLGVSIHKMAYDLALTDARATGAYKKNGRKKRIGSERPSGTVFSYFPLLKVKRPSSQGETINVQIGVRQDEGRKVAPKNYMKHIFGSIKLADYYPGGKKWRHIE